MFGTTRSAVLNSGDLVWIEVSIKGIDRNYVNWVIAEVLSTTNKDSVEVCLLTTGNRTCLWVSRSSLYFKVSE